VYDSHIFRSLLRRIKRSVTESVTARHQSPGKGDAWPDDLGSRRYLEMVEQQDA
jgi:hypothetical protein